MRLFARDAGDYRFSEIQIIAADSVQAAGGRQPLCLRASHQPARSVVAPSRRTCKSTVGNSAVRSVGTPTLVTIRPVTNSLISGISIIGQFIPC